MEDSKAFMDRLRSPLSHTQFTDRLAASTTTTTYASPPTASFNPQTSPFRGNLKDEVEERQRLERQNFDLKLKVFHLEETIKKLQDVEVRNEVHSGMARSELSDLRLQLEEKNIELEQRDLYLVKAKAAIETLKVDLERARQDLDKQADVEDRIRRLKQMNDEIELDYKNQLLRLEAELNQSRQNVGLKHQEKSMLEEKIRQLELTIANMQDAMDKNNVEKGRLEDRWMQCQQQILALDEELTQAKAHVDLYKMQVQESNEETELVKQQLRDVMARKKELEEAHKSRVQELGNQYDAQVRAIRTNHEQDIEKMRANHAQMLNDIRENYQVELSKARVQMERNVQDVKTAEGMDAQRVREEFQNRINEKNSELKALHALIDADRVKYDNLVQDLEAVRTELREKNFLLDHMRSDLSAKGDELHLMSTLRTDLTSSQRKIVELQDLLRAETLEKTQVAVKLEQTQEILDATRQTVKELEAQIHLSKVEVTRLTQTTSELGSKADSIESLARDNEKLRILHNKLQQDVMEAGHKVFNLNKDIEHRDIEINRYQDEIKLLKQELGLVRNDLMEQKNSLEAQVKITQMERETRLATESALNEQRASQNVLKNEIQDLRGKLSAAETNATVQMDDLEHKLHKLIQANAMARRSLMECDDALSVLLDGDHSLSIHDPYFAGRLKSHAIYNASYKSSSRRNQRLGAENVESDDYDMVRELLDKSADDVRHEIAVVIERVSLKMERTQKIRSLFESQVQKHMQRYESIVAQLQERCALLLNRLDTCRTETSRLKSTFDRDRETSRRELEEVKKLREVLLMEHSATIRDHEDRYAKLLLEREQDRVAYEQQKRANEKLFDELKAAQSTVAKQKDELLALDSAEAMMQSFEDRMNALTETNKSLQRDLVTKENQLRAVEQQCHELRGDQSVASSEVEKLSIQLQTKVDLLREADDRIHRLLSEIERLRTRQIDPELAKTLRDSHEQLKKAEFGGWDATQLTSAHIADLRDVEASLRGLVRKSELLLSRAESFMTNSMADGRGVLDNDRLSRLHEEVRGLMEENYKLAQRVEAMQFSWRDDAGSGSRSPQTHSAKAIAAEIAASASRRYAVEGMSSPRGSSKARSSDLYAAPPAVAPSMSSSVAAKYKMGPSATSRGVGDAYIFPSRRGLMTPVTSRTPDVGADIPTYSAGPSIQLDDLRDYPPDVRLRSSALRSTKSATAVDSDPHRMSRLQKIDHNLRLLTQKLDNFEMGK